MISALPYIYIFSIQHIYSQLSRWIHNIGLKLGNVHACLFFFQGISSWQQKTKQQVDVAFFYKPHTVWTVHMCYHPRVVGFKCVFKVWQCSSIIVLQLFSRTSCLRGRVVKLVGQNIIMVQTERCWYLLGWFNQRIWQIWCRDTWVCSYFCFIFCHLVSEWIKFWKTGNLNCRFFPILSIWTSTLVAVVGLGLFIYFFVHNVLWSFFKLV